MQAAAPQPQAMQPAADAEAAQPAALEQPEAKAEQPKATYSEAPAQAVTGFDCTCMWLPKDVHGKAGSAL